MPIIPDEARTFGMDSLFPTAKIYSPYGQSYDAVDRNLLLSYKESEQGQILHEGISESGAMGSVIAAGTSYATHGTHMIPVYVFYSMFGWQRTGDQMWALGDQLGRGFLLGATAGRTTLAGEGLQHNDGHSVLLASVSEACVSYDCAWAFELAYVMRDALRRMYEATGEHPDGENIFYYLTVYNEPYPQPGEPAASRAAPRRWRMASCAGSTRTHPRLRSRSRLPGRRSSPPGWRCARRWRPRRCSPRTGACRPTCGRPRPGPSCAATRWPASRGTC